MSDHGTTGNFSLEQSGVGRVEAPGRLTASLLPLKGLLLGEESKAYLDWNSLKTLIREFFKKTTLLFQSFCHSSGLSEQVCGRDSPSSSFQNSDRRWWGWGGEQGPGF